MFRHSINETNMYRYHNNRQITPKIINNEQQNVNLQLVKNCCFSSIIKSNNYNFVL